ncbi:cysteine desulfurase family protein [Flavobacterium haoranii]|uniref:cysteine desulfurase n=1 Tax=Flavobacterium haoranii TaxID=683124 RepID=A0A1M6LZW8_9FLAO|nr:cysteine desulfurase family protein [Flavobacterium haoranii]SHJ76553.1 cysteine desulfurase [Flavobacterium haoranii]
MEKVYLDNASTTRIRPEVITHMTEVMSQEFGNASSTHSFGRSAKVILETSRKTIASLIGAKSSEILFTSCGTESNNWVLRSAVKDFGVKRIITSKIEHHAVLYTVLALQSEYGISVEFVPLEINGAINYHELENILSEETQGKTLVSLMHVNNEIGTILDLEKVGTLCQNYNALFHSDTVQSVGKMEINLAELPVDFITASAHKFHGPKGVGILFVKKNHVLQPLLFGGEQEKGWRAGTEAVHQVAGMAKALEVSYQKLAEERNHIQNLKNYLREQLLEAFPEVVFNGEQFNGSFTNETFYNLVNVMLPFSTDKTSMILFALDMKGIAVSRGSACQSGSVRPSHVLAEILNLEDIQKPSLRISLSHYNTKEEIDYLIEMLKAV